MEIQPEFMLFSSYLLLGVLPQRQPITSLWGLPLEARQTILDKLGYYCGKRGLSAQKPEKILQTLKQVIIQKQCFDNALLVCEALGENDICVNYVEGEAVSNMCSMPVVHAWNYLPKYDRYFDLTWEIWLSCSRPKEFKLQESQYYPAVQGSLAELENQGYEIHRSADLFTQWLNKVNKQKRPQNTPFAQLRDRSLKSQA